jgi:hypothetical protein
MEAVGYREQGGCDQRDPFLVKLAFDGLAESSDPPRRECGHEEDPDRGEVRGEPHGKLTYFAEDGAYTGAYPVKKGRF